MIIDIPLRLEIPQGNLSALRNGYDTHGEEYRILKTRVIAKDRCQPQSEKNKTLEFHLYPRYSVKHAAVRRGKAEQEMKNTTVSHLYEL